MSDITCPCCDEDFDVPMDEGWNPDGFQVICPECHKLLNVDVQVSDVEYEAWQSNGEPWPKPSQLTAAQSEAVAANQQVIVLAAANEKLTERVAELENKRRVYHFDAKGVALGAEIAIVAESVNEAYELARQWCSSNSVDGESLRVRRSSPFHGSMVVYGWNGDY